jgi:hypothetical protein
MARTHVVLIATFVASPVYAADVWDVGEDFLGAAIADEHWTIDESFPGTKVIVAGRYTLRRGEIESRTPACQCEPLPAPERLIGTFGGHLQWGQGESDLEYGVASFTSWAWKRDLAADAAREPPRETLELGVVKVRQDEPLGIESYVELTAARIARTWAFRPPESPWHFTVGANLAGGYAWAESTDERYRDISNMIVGTWAKGTVSREKWGSIYLEQRVENGWTFSSPARGGPVSRAAAARFGYTNRLFQGCLGIELFAEKRSFNFADPDGPSLYTKAKRVGIEVSCVL